MSDQRLETAAPVLGEAFQEPVQDKTAEGTANNGMESKSGRRRFWGLGKKKEDDKTKNQQGPTSSDVSPVNSPDASQFMRPVSPLKVISGVPTLNKTTSHPYSPSSPARNLQSSSPAPPSPASSQIFERHVQEDSLVIGAQAPIPGHITTENHIPPVLDASSEAITNDELDPDQVEIVMHAAHQPAAVTVTGAPAGDLSGSPPLEEPLIAPDSEDGASNYGNLDSTDVRRLSFISFADVVHAEHTHDAGSAATGMISPIGSHNRSPSPIRSPLSPQGFSGSPNPPASLSSRGLEASPIMTAKGLSSPLHGHSPPGAGELTVETMRQALRKTGSGDLSHARSVPVSATIDRGSDLEGTEKSS